MTSNSANNKRIARNTVLLYVRMLFTIVISLYTSRVILNTLGVEDYGIYGLVGGVVIMLTFVNSSMSGATSRFITFALGENNAEKLRDIFNTAFYIHMIIAVAIVLIAETAGLWFITNKLQIPSERFDAAVCVFHLFVVSTIIPVIQTPFNATIIAYERMDVYAYFEILNSILKLAIVFLLPSLPYDKLITYGFLFLAVNIVIFICYVAYTRTHFEVCRVVRLKNYANFKPMLQYCMWDLFGSLSGTLKQQGTNVLINMFFGVLLNAASAIATQIQAAVSGLAQNVIHAFRPPIIKSFSQNNIPLMQQYVCNAIKYSLLLYSLCIVPLYIELDFVLHIWLGVVPEYASSFCRLLLINSYIGLAVMILITSNHATGKIKYLSTATGIYNLLILPVTYMAFRYFKAPPEATYIVGIGFASLTLITDMLITKRLIPAIHLRKISESIINPALITLVAFTVTYLVKICDAKPIIEFFLVIAVSVICHLVLTFWFALSKEMRGSVINRLKKTIAP